MRSQFQTDELDKMCWIINLQRKSIKLEFIDYKKYSSFTFIDPAKNIFGFTFLPHTNSPHKTTLTSENHRYSSPNPHLEQPTLKGSLDRYINLPEQRESSKEPVMPVKKSLNLRENIPTRKISSSSTRSPTYKNQLGLFKKEQTGKKDVRATTGEFAYKQPNRTYKVNNYLPAKKSMNQSDYISSSFNNSDLRMVTTDRSTPRSRVTMTLTSAGQMGQQRFYKKVRDIIRK